MKNKEAIAVNLIGHCSTEYQLLQDSESGGEQKILTMANQHQER